MTQLADDLRAAKALLVMDGASQRKAVFAIVDSCGGDAGREDAALIAFERANGTNVVRFQDDDRTDAEVLAGFDKAIAAAEGGA